MEVKTSETHPIRVDFLPEDAGPWPARLGMTFAPGKKAVGIAGNWDRDLDMDLERLVNEFDATVLVSLLERHEYADLRIPSLPNTARKHGLEFIDLEIPDGGVPPSMDEAMDFVPRVLELLRTGGVVVVHCRGGLGRTGLIVACCLTTAGHEARHAIAMVRDARRGTIENSMQEEFVAEFAEAWSRIAAESGPAA